MSKRVSLKEGQRVVRYNDYQLEIFLSNKDEFSIFGSYTAKKISKKTGLPYEVEEGLSTLAFSNMSDSQPISVEMRLDRPQGFASAAGLGIQFDNLLKSKRFTTTKKEYLSLLDKLEKNGYSPEIFN